RLLAPLHQATEMPLLKAINLVTTRQAGSAACAGRAASGRYLFLVPWRGRLLCGTWESSRQVAEADSEAHDEEVVAFITELNQAFPALRLTRDEVSLVHRGLVPAFRASNGRIVLEGHERIRDHSADGLQSLVSVAGTKYTTARIVAER